MHPQFADDAALGGSAGLLEAGKAPQRDLGGLERWAQAGWVMLSAARCRVLLPGRNNPVQRYRRGEERLESCPAEKDPGALVDSRLRMSRQRARVANGMLACVSNSVASRTGAGIVPRYSAPRIPRWVLGPEADREGLERVQRRATKPGKGLENRPDEERPRELEQEGRKRPHVAPGEVRVGYEEKGLHQKGRRAPGQAARGRGGVASPGGI